MNKHVFVWASQSAIAHQTMQVGQFGSASTLRATMQTPSTAMQAPPYTLAATAPLASASLPLLRRYASWTQLAPDGLHPRRLAENRAILFRIGRAVKIFQHQYRAHVQRRLAELAGRLDELRAKWDLRRVHAKYEAVLALRHPARERFPARGLALAALHDLSLLQSDMVCCAQPSVLLLRDALLRGAPKVLGARCTGRTRLPRSTARREGPRVECGRFI